MEAGTPTSRIAAVALGALAALGIGGAGLARAQEAPTTTAPPSTEPPALPDSGPEDGTGRDTGAGCDKDGDGADDTPGPAPGTDQTSL